MSTACRSSYIKQKIPWVDVKYIMALGNIKESFYIKITVSWCICLWGLLSNYHKMRHAHILWRVAFLDSVFCAMDHSWDIYFRYIWEVPESLKSSWGEWQECLAQNLSLNLQVNVELLIAFSVIFTFIS